MKLGLVLTNDWELYGDGSGDYFELQHKPLESLLDVIDSQGAKITIMAEVGQQWAHQKISEQEPWAREITGSWEAILKKAVKRKADVQLHLHPQWLNAHYEHGRWHVDFSQWAISSLPENTVEEVLKRGKRYLDGLLQTVDPGYKCIAFRAGDYQIEPSAAVIRGLLGAGIICDSSVTKGMYVPPYYDFRDAHSNFLPWVASDKDIKYSSHEKKGLLEIPISSYETITSLVLRELFPQLSNLLSFRVRINKQDREWLARNNREKLKRYPLLKRPFMTKNIKSFKWLSSILISKGSVQLDYDKLPPNVFVKCLQKVIDSDEAKRWVERPVVIPVVASGHVKAMCDCNNIVRIIKEIKHSLGDKVVFWTLSEAVESWIKEIT